MAVSATVEVLAGFVGVGVQATAQWTKASMGPSLFLEEADRVVFGPDPFEEDQLPHRGLVGL